MPKVYVPELEEFAGLIENAKGRTDCSITDLDSGYKVIEGAAPLKFSRREIGVRPAIWYSLFSGGVDGRIVDFGWDEVTILDA